MVSEVQGLRVEDLSFFDDRAFSAAYGADVVTAQYCGINGRRPRISGIWQHGWLPSYLSLGPVAITGQVNDPDPNERYYVARKDQQRFLEERGFRDVFAIGLPIVYLRPSVVKRQPGSLLVMPPHSMGSSFDDWDEEGYASAIDSIKHHFRHVVVCIHPSCRLRGYWVEEFRKRGYELTTGFGGPSGVPLEGIRDLMSRFEFMTTNGFGSHIMYAAYH